MRRSSADVPPAASAAIARGVVRDRARIPAGETMDGRATPRSRRFAGGRDAAARRGRRGRGCARDERRRHRRESRGGRAAHARAARAWSGEGAKEKFLRRYSCQPHHPSCWYKINMNGTTCDKTCEILVKAGAEKYRLISRRGSVNEHLKFREGGGRLALGAVAGAEARAPRGVWSRAPRGDAVPAASEARPRRATSSRYTDSETESETSSSECQHSAPLRVGQPRRARRSRVDPRGEHEQLVRRDSRPGRCGARRTDAQGAGTPRGAGQARRGSALAVGGAGCARRRASSLPSRPRRTWRGSRSSR